MVIVPEIAETAAFMAARLKVESQADTDVSIIAAADLHWLAEKWAASGDGKISIEVFNTTGILDRATIDQRVKLFS